MIDISEFTCFFYNNGITYEVNRALKPISFFSKESFVPLGTVRMIGGEMFYAFTVTREFVIIPRILESYRIHWVKVTKENNQ